MDFMDIDLGMLPWHFLNSFFTQIFREEKMKAKDMNKKTAKKSSETDEDVAKFNAYVVYEYPKLSVQFEGAENEPDTLVIDNTKKIIQTLLPGKVRELIDEFKDLITEKVKPFIYSALGGALS